jgi:hypothetical protein
MDQAPSPVVPWLLRKCYSWLIARGSAPCVSAHGRDSTSEDSDTKQAKPLPPWRDLHGRKESEAASLERGFWDLIRRNVSRGAEMVIGDYADPMSANFSLANPVLC